MATADPAEQGLAGGVGGGCLLHLDDTVHRSCRAATSGVPTSSCKNGDQEVARAHFGIMGGP